MKPFLAKKANLSAKSESIRRNAVFWLTMSLLVLIPLSFNTHLHRTYVVPKLGLLLVGVSALIPLIALSSASLFKSRHVVIAGVYTLVALSSTIFSSDAVTSLFGHFYNQMGLITRFGFFVCFIGVIYGIGLNRSRLEKMLWAMIFAGLLVSTLVLLLVTASQSYPSLRLPVQSPSAAGRWYIDFSFSDTSKHTLRFEADDLGKGSYLLLDIISNMVEPAQLSKAEWTQPAGSNQLTISGTIEFPIGNVGRDEGTLVFKGTFETADLITGDIEFFRDPGNLTPSRSGTFKATRITDQSAPRVALLSPNSGGRVRRGAEVEIEWQAESGFPIFVQQILVSLDKGKNFVAITPLLDGTTSHVTWTVPDTLPTVKKALLKVMVINVAGDRAEDVSKRTFKIR